jgi:signal transduction histidine kinase
VAAGAAPNGDRAPAGYPGDELAGARGAWWRPWQLARRHPLKNWRVRSRLLLLVAVSTLAALVLGVLSIGSSYRSAQAFGRVQHLAVLSGDVTDLVQALQNELEDSVTFITMANDGGRLTAQSKSPGGAAPELLLLSSDETVTNRAAAPVRSLAATIGSSYSALAQQEAKEAITEIADLPSLRTAVLHTKIPVLAVIDDYGNTITQLLALENEVAAGSNDAALADNVRAVSLISAMKEEAVQQQAIVTSALRPSLVGAVPIGAQALSVLDEQESEEAANETAFSLAATSSQRQLFNSALSSASTAQAQQEMQQASSLLASETSSTTNPDFEVAANDAAFTVTSLRTIEQRLMSTIISQAGSLRDRAVLDAVIEAIAVLLVLALALLLISIVGRSMTRPLRRLRIGALEIAGVRLPEAVRQMGESDGAGVPLEVEPIDVDSTDEIGEVARAFDQVHREALRLAATEAALRGNVNAMFVNLSRRSQSLVERQIRLIDDLEQGEQDPERLASLFNMDHLATRMRRNSENLLVLAGHDVSRRWNQPVPLVDVVRAALSEIEQYERVTLNVQPGISVRGQSVSDVVHLTAELVENATSFSPAETPVTIAGHLLSSGGVLLEITDQGVGMGAEEMAHANWRLDNPPAVDVAVSRRMGLFVVARLAARHGVRVRLRPAAAGGLTALVWLPDEVVTHDGAGSTPGMQRPGLAMAAAAGSAADGDIAAATADGASAAVGEPQEYGWGNAGRVAAEQEVSAARVPRFAPLRADTDDTTQVAQRHQADQPADSGPPTAAGLGPRRIPGAGLRPGPAGPTTGPLPAFRMGAPLAEPSGSDVAATGPQPTIGVGSGELGDQAGSQGDTTAGYDPFGNGAEPASGSAAALLGSGAHGGSDGPADGSSVTSDTGSFGSGAGSSRDGRDGVVVPSAESLVEENRLPIFEAVESDWFRRGRQSVGRPSAHDGDIGNGWSSPADEGWRAAAAVHEPSSGGVTAAGLPKRVPQANLVPGAVTSATPEPAPALAPARSAAATRDRFASFQRGIREGRAAASTDEDSGDGRTELPDGA